MKKSCAIGIVGDAGSIYGQHDARSGVEAKRFDLERNMRIIPMRASRLVQSGAIAFLFALSTVAAYGGDQHKTNKFEGPKANTGMAVHTVENGKSILRVTSDFKVPDTPAPTWRVVDRDGNIYTLDAFKIKGGEKREVTVPNYVRNIAKVQVYCAWAQILLGEASFSEPVESKPPTE